MTPHSELDIDIDLDGCLPDVAGCEEFPGPGCGASLVVIFALFATFLALSNVSNGAVNLVLGFMGLSFILFLGSVINGHRKRHRR